jgi:hypothetical protein
VMGIRNERNDEIVCSDLSIQVWRVCIEGDGFRSGKTGCEALCAFEGPTGCPTVKPQENTDISKNARTDRKFV